MQLTRQGCQTKKPKSFTSTSYRVTCCGLLELSSPTAWCGSGVPGSKNLATEKSMTHPINSSAIVHSPSHFHGYGVIFVLLFLVFIVLALAGQMLVLNWRNWLPGAEGSTSTLDGVKSSVYTVISQLS